jgi:hypothetical protein
VCLSPKLLNTGRQEVPPVESKKDGRVDHYTVLECVSRPRGHFVTTGSLKSSMR